MKNKKVQIVVLIVFSFIVGLIIGFCDLSIWHKLWISLISIGILYATFDLISTD